MKKLIGLIILNSFAFGAQVTQQQAKTVIPITQSILDSAYKMETLATFIYRNPTTYTVAGSTQAYNYTAQQNSDILANYQTLKANICNTQCNSLP